ncbi:MAG: radical SAM protein [Candidatus Omnitrophota bacterium]
MKIILVNSTSSLVRSNLIYRNFVLPLLPAGIGYIGAVLKRDGHSVITIDLLANKISDEEFLKKIEEEKPQIVGFSCLTSSATRAIDLAKKIKILNSRITLVWGNIHPTIFAEEILSQGLADIVVRGEGEITISELISAIENKGTLRDVQGISFRENGHIFHSPDRELIEDLDDLVYPAWDLFDLKDYRRGCPMVSLYDVAIPIVGSRGCPYDCVFCSQEKFYKKARFRNSVKIVDEIETMHKRYQANFFGFTDANFPFSIRQGHEFCDEIIRRGLNKKIKWITETRADLVDPELLKKMKESGLHTIMYGFEVGNAEILKGTKKGTTLEQARQAMAATKKAGILSLGLFMLGLPGETRSTCEDTIRFSKELDCDFAKFNIIVPYPGSKLFEDYKAKEIIINNPDSATSWLDWFGYTDDRLIYAPEGMSGRELIDLQREAMFQFYVRPKIILRHIFKRTISFRNLILGGYILIRKYIRTLFRRSVGILGVERK